MKSMAKPGTPAEYAAAFKKAIAGGDDLEKLNQANHIALDRGLITMEHFQAAAKVLAVEILKR